MAHRERVDVDLPLTIEAGEVVALLGPNGSGKSTALAVISGLLAPSGGHLRVAGRTLHDEHTWLPPEQRRVGVVFQEGRLFGHLSALDNVAYAPIARGLSRKDARARARAQLEAVGAAHVASARPRELSGGQAQRVALARALAADPEVLLLDEPMSALDAGSRIGVRADLRRYLGDFKGATIVVTHDVVDATALADRVVVIEDGVPVQVATPSELVATPKTEYVAQLAGITLLRGHSDGRQVRLEGGGTLELAAPIGEVFLAIDPRDVRLSPAGSAPGGSAPGGDVSWRGRVADIEQHGRSAHVKVVSDDRPDLVSEVDALRQPYIEVGSDIVLAVEASSLVVYSR